ncbi:hypothetical protein [Rhabdothermincola sp.]|uniref:hypothetical protein n=1 Tax=Rhabdothermincola sp. TaxID=2820405 RepID=UPI002FE40C0F
MSPPVEGPVAPWSWHLVRASAIALALLAPVELVSWLIVPDVARWDAVRLAARWESPVWRVADWSFLVLGLLHATLGARERLGRSLRPGAALALADAAVLCAGVALGLLGTRTAFTFGL